MQFAETRPYLLLTVTALLWAGNAIAGKFAVDHISPFLLTTLRWLTALAVVLPFAWPHLRRQWPMIRAHLPFLAALGALGFTLFNNLFYLALYHTSAINVAIEQASLPLIVFTLNFLLFGIRAGRLQFVGFTLTLLGIAVTVTRGDLRGIAGQTLNVGDLYMLLAITLYGFYSVVVIRRPPIHWLSFIAVLAGAALLASLPFALWEALAGRLVAPDAIGLAAIAYTGIFPSIVAQLFWVRGLELIGSNRGGVFINLVPIFAAALAVLLLGEAFHLYHLTAIVLVLAGVWLTQR